ncbi:non-hydrolyzing UDP-N-acetylglucosamine 2-epimerase [Pseudoflavonifractor phocaeensis]|uniref:non-hydrolyzing UDP-N-acetylglucosamine 2-epimerase n=1 Tax=Pseudoflavonifractor phocaeensis TaxID=1870988 RepID=UPI001F345BD4|nr:UDP-N-acetylglucosamine 2-epimerase (non-hydrolyzing) [Pseudoflavonifractor phocaeensis]MCF2595528.1 UDP-N-acetylglucosamine 2-epimerase (non-hydrolyzing) [Pseudoflavonifractor phocaeensis]
MKKICTVVGARPQFIKLAVVSRVLRKEFREVLIHTGQHYDYNMSDVFFEEMDIPRPDYNLGISGGTHGQMTGQMLIKIEEVLMKEQPDMVLLFGDTNSTMAAAMAAVKLHIPVCHVEAGNRFGTLDSPEEVNRTVTDHVSAINLPCTESSLRFLEREGLGHTATVVGDPMYDAFRYYTERLDGGELTELTDFAGSPVTLPETFYYMTCHRQENTDTDEKLRGIFDAMEALDAPTIYPVHPRNHQRAERLQREHGYRNLILTAPVGYKTSISLVNHAKKVVTDSGGVQREAFFAGKSCVTVLDFVVWPETMKDHCNQLAKPDKADILEKLSASVTFDPAYQPFGDGHSAEKIVEKIKEFLA